MSTTFRSDRAAEAIRATIASALNTDVQDPRLRLVTITRVEVSHDLQSAKVFYTILGDDKVRLDAHRGFESAKPFLRTRVGVEVPLRVVPEIQFRYDGGTDNAMIVDEILNSLPELKTKDEG